MSTFINYEYAFEVLFINSFLCFWVTLIYKIYSFSVQLAVLKWQLSLSLYFYQYFSYLIILYACFIICVVQTCMVLLKFVRKCEASHQLCCLWSNYLHASLKFATLFAAFTLQLPAFHNCKSGSQTWTGSLQCLVCKFCGGKHSNCGEHSNCQSSTGYNNYYT